MTSEQEVLPWDMDFCKLHNLHEDDVGYNLMNEKVLCNSL